MARWTSFSSARSRFWAVVTRPTPGKFGEEQFATRHGVVVAFEIIDGNLPGNRKAEDRLRRIDAVPAGQRDAGTFAGGAAAFNDACGYGGGKFLQWPTENSDRHEWCAAHGVNVTDGIDGSNLPEVEWVIDDGHEKIRGADDGLAVAEVVRSGVVLGIVADQQLRVRRGLAGKAEDFLQHGGRNFAAATGAMAVLREANGITHAGGIRHFEK